MNHLDGVETNLIACEIQGELIDYSTGRSGLRDFYPGRVDLTTGRLSIERPDREVSLFMKDGTPFCCVRVGGSWERYAVKEEGVAVLTAAALMELLDAVGQLPKPTVSNSVLELGLPKAVTDGCQPSAMAVAEVVLDICKRQVEKGRSLENINLDPSVQVWQLFASLQEYCAAHGIDLDEQIADVRKQIASGDVKSPLWSETQRKQPVCDALSLFVISGRIHGDDDDTALVIQAASEADAVDFFHQQMLEEEGHVDLEDEATHPEIYVNSKKCIGEFVGAGTLNLDPQYRRD